MLIFIFSVYSICISVAFGSLSPHNLIPQVMDQMSFHSVKLQYFDHALMRNLSGIASCLAISPSFVSSKATSPKVNCEKNDIIIKLSGRKLKRVFVSGEY